MQKIFLTACLSSLLPVVACAQESPTYNLKFLKAQYVDLPGAAEFQVFIQVTPKPGMKRQFPPVLSMRLRYTLGDSAREDTVDILTNRKQVRLTVLDKSLKYKSQFLYNLLSAEANWGNYTDDNMIVLAFYFGRVADKPVKKMAMTYGLWEKNDLNQRFEQKFEFAIKR